MTDHDDHAPPEGYATGGPITGGNRVRIGGREVHERVIPLPEPRPVRAGDVVTVPLRYDGSRWHPVFPGESSPGGGQRQVAPRPPWWRRDSLTLPAVLAVLAGTAAAVVFYGVLPGLAMIVLGVAAGIAIGRNLG